jgi:hypothetical protein
MPIELTKAEHSDQRILEVHATGTLTRNDYLKFLPEVERISREAGKLRFLVSLSDFHGWDSGALWEDIKFDVRHYSDIERLAIVGDKKWEQWMSTFCRPFTTATIRYFDQSKIQDARLWLTSVDLRKPA